MLFYGVGRDVKLGRDLLVRPAREKQTQHVAFTCGDARERAQLIGPLLPRPGTMIRDRGRVSSSFARWNFRADFRPALPQPFVLATREHNRAGEIDHGMGDVSADR